MSSLPEQTRLLPAIWLSCAIDARRSNLYARYLVTLFDRATRKE